MKTEKIIEEIVESSSDITGNVVGTVLGGLVAGPAGLILGGTSGVIVTRVFKRIGKEVKERVLGTREELRIGAAYTFAINRIIENQRQGRVIRGDDFFSEIEDDRSFSEEILEGVILTAQREYEEKKIRFLGNLYGNICTNELISKDQANSFIKMADTLTYRQFCMIALYFKKLNLTYTPSNIMVVKDTSFDIIAELTDLHQKGILLTPKVSIEASGFSEKRYVITKGGILFYKMLGLDQIDENELIILNNLLKVF